MAIWSSDPTLKPDHAVGTSAPQNTSVGSGSRPTSSKYKIPTSAPRDARRLDGRGDVPGALGMGGAGKDQGVR